MSAHAVVVILVLLCLVAGGCSQIAPGHDAGSSAGPAAPANLRCEYLVNPLGIDRTTPRLSWEMVDARRGAMQNARQILVADNPELLDHDVGNLWDSGKVVSDETIHVAYAGRPLHS